MRHVLRTEPVGRQVQFRFQVVSVTCGAVTNPVYPMTDTHTHTPTYTQYLSLSIDVYRRLCTQMIYLFIYLLPMPMTRVFP